jgi:hypothetical protein
VAIDDIVDFGVSRLHNLLRAPVAAARDRTGIRTPQDVVRATFDTVDADARPWEEDEVGWGVRLLG